MRILPTEEENAVSMRCSFLSVRTGLEARRSDRTLRASVSKHPVHPNSMTLRKRRAIDGHGEVLSNGVERRRRDHEDTEPELYAKIGGSWMEFLPDWSAGRITGKRIAGVCLSHLHRSIPTGQVSTGPRAVHLTLNCPPKRGRSQQC